MRAAGSRRGKSAGHAVAWCVVLLAKAAVAQTYSVRVHPELNGLDVRIEPVASTAMLVVKLTNATATKVRCDLRYDAAPQPLYRKATYVDPGKTEQSVFSAKRKWMSVDVYVACKASDK